MLQAIFELTFHVLRRKGMQQAIIDSQAETKQRRRKKREEKDTQTTNVQVFQVYP